MKSSQKIDPKKVDIGGKSSYVRAEVPNTLVVKYLKLVNQSGQVKGEVLAWTYPEGETESSLSLIGHNLWVLGAFFKVLVLLRLFWLLWEK